MLQVSKISTSGMKKLQLTFLLGFMMSFVAFAQTERERNYPDLPKNSESATQFESHESSSADSKQDNGQKTNLNPIKDPKPSTAAGLKKDNTLYRQGGEKDTKKEEISTLSFNLFLYIVDRFKED
jgi:hypothetical protein